MVVHEGYLANLKEEGKANIKHLGKKVHSSPPSSDTRPTQSRRTVKRREGKGKERKGKER